MNWYGTSLGEAIVLDDTIAVMGELYAEEASSDDGHDSGGASGHTLEEPVIPCSAMQCWRAGL